MRKNFNKKIINQKLKFNQRDKEKRMSVSVDNIDMRENFNRKKTKK